MVQSQGAAINATAQRLLGDGAQTQAIATSHARSAAFGLCPQTSVGPDALTHEALRAHRERHARLLSQAAPLMDTLVEQLGPARQFVMLADASGVILHLAGDAGFVERVRAVGLMVGASWSEASRGTNAVGTCLMNERPTMIHGSEHFLRALHFLSCVAAPLLDHKGGLKGVIGIATERRGYHPHSLALVGMTARMIELACFDDRFGAQGCLHFHPRAWSLGTPAEGRLAIDAQGRWLGADHRAMELLGDGMQRLRREGLAGLLGPQAHQLLDLARDTVLPVSVPLQSTGISEQLSLRYVPGGAEGQAIALPEEPDGARAAYTLAATFAPAAPMVDRMTTLREAEKHAIEAAVQSCAGNLSMAARQLGIGRSTLYRKIKIGGPGG